VKRWIQILVAGIVGAVIGFGATEPMSMYKFWIGRDLQSFGSRFYSAHDFAGAFSLAALGKLEVGDPESAKVFLAREVAAWYRDSQKEPTSAERQKIRSMIETMSEKSEILKKELAKSADNSKQ